jgi:hypothetical protein
MSVVETVIYKLGAFILTALPILLLVLVAYILGSFLLSCLGIVNLHIEKDMTTPSALIRNTLVGVAFCATIFLITLVIVMI